MRDSRSSVSADHVGHFREGQAPPLHITYSLFAIHSSLNHLGGRKGRPYKMIWYTSCRARCPHRAESAPMRLSSRFVVVTLGSACGRIDKPSDSGQTRPGHARPWLCPSAPVLSPLQAGLALGKKTRKANAFLVFVIQTYSWGSSSQQQGCSGAGSPSQQQGASSAGASSQGHSHSPSAVHSQSTTSSSSSLPAALMSSMRSLL